MNSAADYYLSGEFWRNNKSTDSSYKVAVLDALLKKADITLPEILKGAELGCGDGGFLFPLANYLTSQGVQFTLTGVDIAPMAIEAAESNNQYPKSAVSFEIATAEDLPSGFDIIFCIDVLEHVENPWEILRGLEGKSEYLILHLPIEQSLGHMLMRSATRSNSAYNHINFYSWDSATILLKESPFQIVDYQFTPATKGVLGLECQSRFKQIFRYLRYLAYKLNPRFTSILGGGSVLFLLKNRNSTSSLTLSNQCYESV